MPHAFELPALSDTFDVAFAAGDTFLEVTLGYRPNWRVTLWNRGLPTIDHHYVRESVNGVVWGPWSADLGSFVKDGSAEVRSGGGDCARLLQVRLNAAGAGTVTVDYAADG